MKIKEIEILIKHRLEQAHEALDDAKYLIDGNRSPQSIVNRSYYAMFYATLALLQKIAKVPTKHSGVISLFDREFVMKEIFISHYQRIFTEHLNFDNQLTIRSSNLFQLLKPMKFGKKLTIMFNQLSTILSMDSQSA